MNIHTALKKIDSLSKEELKHLIQRMDIELKNYERCILNYSPYEMKRFGIPYQNKLRNERKKFVDKFDSL